MIITLRLDTEARLREKARCGEVDVSELADALLSNAIVDDRGG